MNDTKNDKRDTLSMFLIDLGLTCSEKYFNFAMISKRFPKPPQQNGELDRMMGMVRARGQFQLLNGNSLGISYSKKTGC